MQKLFLFGILLFSSFDALSAAHKTGAWYAPVSFCASNGADQEALAKRWALAQQGLGRPDSCLNIAAYDITADDIARRDTSPHSDDLTAPTTTPRNAETTGIHDHLSNELSPPESYEEIIFNPLRQITSTSLQQRYAINTQEDTAYNQIMERFNDEGRRLDPIYIAAQTAQSIKRADQLFRLQERQRSQDPRSDFQIIVANIVRANTHSQQPTRQHPFTIHWIK